MTRALTMDEAADMLRIGRRAFQEIVKRYPFYYPNGKRKLFTPDDIAAIQRALREEQQCRSNSLNRVPAKRHTGISGGQKMDATLTQLQERLAKQTRPSSSGKNERKSNVVSINPARR